MKRLLSHFNRVSSRPHRPRSEIIRRMMERVGIPIPDGSVAGDDDVSSAAEGEGEEEDCTWRPCWVSNHLGRIVGLAISVNTT